MSMRRSQILMIVGVILALSLGLALAYPLLITQMPTLDKPELGLSVVYTYISAPLNDSGLTGIWRNSSDGWQTENLVFNYMIVLNITNYSSTTVQVRSLETDVGPSITVNKDTSAMSARNSIIVDSRMTDGSKSTFIMSFDGLLPPKESKLVCLSGFTGIPKSFYSAVNGGGISVYGKAEGYVAYSNGPYTSAYDLKQIQLQNINGNYLYNSLLNDDQMLRVYGMTAWVVPRNLD